MATSSGGGDDSIICTLSELKYFQSGQFHSEGHVGKPDTPAIQAHAVIGQDFVESKGERIFNSEDSSEQVEEMLFNSDNMKRAGTGLYGCEMFSSLPRPQEIYRDFAEIPKIRREPEDINQHSGGQSFVAEPQLQYGTEAMGQRQTTEFYDANSDANCQQFPAVSTTTFCEDRGKYKLNSSWLDDCVSKVTTSRNIRQQRMSPSQFAPHRVSPTISTGE
jgi:hypothetical protein